MKIKRVQFTLITLSLLIMITLEAAPSSVKVSNISDQDITIKYTDEDNQLEAQINLAPDKITALQSPTDIYINQKKINLDQYKGSIIITVVEANNFIIEKDTQENKPAQKSLQERSIIKVIQAWLGQAKQLFSRLLIWLQQHDKPQPSSKEVPGGLSEPHELPPIPTSSTQPIFVQSVQQEGLHCGYHALHNAHTLMQSLLRNNGQLDPKCLTNAASSAQLIENLNENTLNSWKSRIIEYRKPELYEKYIAYLLKDCITDSETLAAAQERNISNLAKAIKTALIAQKSITFYEPENESFITQTVLVNMLTSFLPQQTPIDRNNHDLSLRFLEAHLDADMFKLWIGAKMTDEQEFLQRAYEYGAGTREDLSSEELELIINKEDYGNILVIESCLLDYYQDLLQDLLNDPTQRNQFGSIRNLLTAGRTVNEPCAVACVINAGGQDVQQNLTYIKEHYQDQTEASLARIQEIIMQAGGHWVALVIYQDAAGNRSYYCADSISEVDNNYAEIAITIEALGK